MKSIDCRKNRLTRIGVIVGYHIATNAESKCATEWQRKVHRKYKHERKEDIPFFHDHTCDGQFYYNYL